MGLRRIFAIVSVLLVGCPVSDADGKRRQKRAPVVTFQGFRSTDDGSQLYLLLNRRPSAQPRIERKGNTVTLILPGARTSRRFRFLDTRYFATPVRLVKTSRKRNNLIFTITLKANVSPKLDVKDTKTGVVVALNFPPGDRTTAPPPRPRGYDRPAPTPDTDGSTDALDAGSDEAFTQCLERCDEKYPDRFDDNDDLESFESCSSACDE